MTIETINEKDFYKTADLALVAVIFLYFPLEAIDRSPSSRKAFFIFKRDSQLDELIENYWRGELKVEPQAYFNALRSIKARLYSEE